MARSASAKEMDYVYFAEIWTKTVDANGQTNESYYYEGPYMDKRSAKRQSNDAQRRINDQRDANMIGPNAKPYYNGTVCLEKTAEVVRSKLVLEVVA